MHILPAVVLHGSHHLAPTTHNLQNHCMTILQKAFVAVVLTAATGTGVFENGHTAQLHNRVHELREQQAPEIELIRELQQECDDAMNRLAALMVENEQLMANRNKAEILTLRKEVAQLKADEVQKDSDRVESEANSWLERVEQLKQYVEHHPEEKIPEFQFLTNREWLLEAAPGDAGAGFAGAIQDLKSQAEDRFAQVVQTVLQKYSQANNGQFPTDLTQLQPYCDPSVEDILQQRYEIRPASILPATQVKDLNIKTDWVIAGKEPIASNSADHLAIFNEGYAFFW
jgi:hypothetical protein